MKRRALIERDDDDASTSTSAVAKGFYSMDCESLLSQMKHADKLIKLKRRWLMGIPVSKYEENQRQDLLFHQNRTMPESFIRDDDVFCETLAKVVENAFGVTNLQSKDHSTEEIHNLDTPSITKELSSRLDDISSEGLYLLAIFFTGGLIKLEKIRWKLKKVILKYLQRKHKCDNNFCKECGQLTQIVTDPCFMRKGSTPLINSGYRYTSARVNQVLDSLENLPTLALLSMYNKLRGKSDKMPQLESKRSGWNRSRLINQVKKLCKSKLAELREDEELPQSIMKAMAVATLSMKLAPSFRNQAPMDFYQYSPDVFTLQNDIAKAIWKINDKVRLPELQKLQISLGLSTKLPIKSLRSAIRKMLMMFLFECEDMDVIPSTLLETLSFVHRISYKVPLRYIPKEEIDEDMECVLGVSAQAKQIILDVLPDHSFDQEFTDAYMENVLDSEESGDDSVDDDSIEPEESVCDSAFFLTSVVECGPTICESNSDTTMQTESDFIEAHDLRSTASTDDIPPSTLHNNYISVQEACDETSLVAYKLIGRVLKEYARIEGVNLDPVDVSYLNGDCSTAERRLSDEIGKKASQADDVGGMFISRVVEELLPSASCSFKSKLEEMMSLL